jgi:acyl-CoA dehydrogenase
MRHFAFGLTDEQRMIVETTERMVRPFEGRRQEFARALREHGRVPEDFWTALGEAGLLGAFVPEAYGGTAMGLVALATAADTMSSKGFGHPMLLLTGMDALCIARSGSEEMKRRLLPPIAAGKLKMSFAITEANAGTNSFRMTTRAVRKGDHFIIDGEKTFITGIDQSTTLMVARTRSRDELERGAAEDRCLSASSSTVPRASRAPLRCGPSRRDAMDRALRRGRCPENLVGEEHAGAL